MNKKYMSLIIFLVLAISLNGCSLKQNNLNSSVKLNVLVFDGEYHSNQSMALKQYELWKTEFNKRFDENINVEARLINPWGFTEMGGYNFETETKGFKSGGILIMPTAAYHSLFIEREKYFEPLDNYLVGSDLRYIWPESLVDFGYFPGDGKTWCLPAQYGVSLLLRAYNKESLTDIGLPAPATMDELNTAMGQYYMQYKKPPILVNPAEKESLLLFSDIFALGGIEGLETIVYDYTSQKYTNIIDLKETEAILGILKDWFYGGIIGSDISLEKNMSFATLSDNDVFTSLVRGPSIMTYDEIVYSNISYEPNSLVYKDFEQIPYVAVLLKGTEKADLVLGKFIDSFLINGEKYIAASKGFEGIHYEYRDGIIVPLKNPLYQLGELSLFSDYDVENYIRDKERDAYIEYKEAYMAKQNKIKPAYLWDFLSLNVFENNRQENSIQTLFIDVFSKLFTEDVPLEELVDEYKSQCYEMGVQNYVDLANDNLETLLEDSGETD